MGKTGKWLKSILRGKRDNKEKEKPCHYNIVSPIPYESPNPTTPISTPTPKEKKRWSFRRSSATPKDVGPTDHVTIAAPPTPPFTASALDAEAEQKKHATAVAAATAAAADAAAAAAQAAAVVIRLTAASSGMPPGPTNAEDAAAVKIQSVFRSYLARKALCALKGLVKLQALVRGHLVRKQATATLRCMQALVTAQARARAQRIRAGHDTKPDFVDYHRTSTHRKSVHDNWLRNPYHEIDMGNMEENVKIVEMDINATKATTKSRNSYSNSHPTTPQPERSDHKLSTTNHLRPPSSGGRLTNCHVSPAQSAVALTEMSPRVHSDHFEDYSFCPAQSSPLQSYAESLSYDFPMCPNYMANTLSSRAKARSQSAPKARPTDALERQPSSGGGGGRRRASMEGPGRNVPPRAVRMQRSSSHAGPAAVNYQYPWSIVKLDRSAVSLKDSECGSTSTVLTNTNYCRSLVAFDIHGHRY